MFKSSTPCNVWHMLSFGLLLINVGGFLMGCLG